MFATQADGVEVRHGALGLRQLRIAATHCRLEPLLANLMKVLCSQEIYKYELSVSSNLLPLCFAAESKRSFVLNLDML